MHIAIAVYLDETTDLVGFAVVGDLSIRLRPDATVHRFTSQSTAREGDWHLATKAHIRCQPLIMFRHNC